MQSRHSQQGLSLIGIVAGLIAVAVVALVVMKIVPHYVDNRALERIIMAVENDLATSERVNTVGAFHQHIAKGMQVNNINDLKSEDIMKITAEGGTFAVDLNYERRESIFKNIDLVVKFEKKYRVKHR